MAEAALAYLADAAIAAGMMETGAFLTVYSAEIIVAAQVAGVAASVYTMRAQQRAAENAAKDAYNASLRDRYTMVRSAIEPRQYVLGRQRVSGPIAFVASYGSTKERLTLVLPVAAHEIDGFESVYFNDRLCRLDGSGYVTGLYTRDTTAISSNTAFVPLSEAPDLTTATAWADYGTTRVNCTIGALLADGLTLTVTGGLVGQTGSLTVQYIAANSPMSVGTVVSESVNLTVTSGAGSVTLPHTPVAGTVHVTTGSNDLTANATITGTTVTVTGAQVPGGGAIASAVAVVSYQYTVSPTKAKITFYTGAPGQTADATLMSLYPGVWTTAHKMSGMAYLILDAIYDPDAWPSGLPNISAVVRGAKLYDPRTGATAWSENPALMQRWALLHPQIGNRTAADVNDTSVIVAANVCDRATNYNVNGRIYSRKLYTAGLTVRSGTKCKDVLDGLSQAMAGRWSFVSGVLRTLAGDYVTPLQTLDDTWLHRGGSVQIQPKVARESLVNVVTGTFADQEQDFKVLAYPRVSAAAYITEDGRELPTDMALNAITFGGQAQQCAAVFLRDARQAMRLTLTCNLRAYAVEWGDSLTVNLPRFGISGVYQVYSTSFTLDGGIQLSLKETSSTIYALGTTFEAQDPSPNTTLKSPGVVPAGPALTLASGTSALLLQQDGTILSRIRVSWPLPSDVAVLEAGGGTEVAWSNLSTSPDDWMSMTAPAGESSLYITGVQDGQLYLLRARYFNAVARGAWGAQNICRVVGMTQPPDAPTALAVTESATARRIYQLTHTQDLDHGGYLIRYSATLTATFDQMTLVAAYWSGASKTGESAAPPDGQWRFAAVAIDSSGNRSAPVYLTATLSAITALAASGGNQLFNGDFSLGWLGWAGVNGGIAGIRDMNLPSWTISTLTPISGGTSVTVQGLPVGNPNAYYEESSSLIPVTPLGWYCASAYTGAHRCKAAVFAYFYDASGASVGNTYGPAATCENNAEMVGGIELAGYKRIFGLGQAPATARTARLVLRKYDTAAGQANSYVFACRAQLEPVSAGATGPGAWTAGPIGYSGDLNATNGAPAGTYVGGQLAEQLVSSVQDMNADNKWVPFEKSALVVDWAEVYGSQTPLVNQANAYGITTERDAFITALNALAGYLNSVSPPWNDTSTTSVIVRATADAKWADTYNTRAVLESKIASEAGKRAAWTSVTDRPAEQANLCWNGSGPTMVGWSAGVTVADWGVTSTNYWIGSMGLTGSRYAISFYQRDSFFGDPIAVRAGDVFSFTADCVHSGAVTGGYDTGIGFFMYDASGAVVAANVAAKLLKTQVNGNLSGPLTIPAGVATARIWVQVDGFSNFNAAGNAGHYTNIIVRRAADRVSLVQTAAPELVMASGLFTEANGVDTGSNFGTGNIQYQIQNGDQIKVTARISNADCRSLDNYVDLFLDVSWKYDGQTSPGGQTSYVHEKFDITPSATAYSPVRNSIQRISFIAPLSVNSGAQRSRTVVLSARLSTYGGAASGAVWNVFFRGAVEITVEVIKKWG